MDREANRENPSLLSTNKINNTNNKQESSHRKQQAATTSTTAASAGGGDRLKRDEWSEGAVSTLLEAYEAKWILRNRAKLKGQDWEDVAKYVSQRGNSTKTPKTQTQCKNKIESMKKRYRSESSTADISSWPLYTRLDLLLRGNAPPKQLPPQPPTHISGENPTSAPPLEATPVAAAPLQQQQPPPPPPPPTMPVGNITQNSHGSNGLDGVAKEDNGDRVERKVSDQESDKNQMETDSSTPALYSDKEKLKSKNFKTRTKSDHHRKKKKQRCEDIMDVAQSIRWLGEVIMRSEQARLDTMKELEKMRAEAEAKRGEMDLKRTEIIANTQLEIAKLFAGMEKGGGGGGGDSSLKIG